MEESYLDMSVDSNDMLGRLCQRPECLNFFRIDVKVYDRSQNKDLFCPYCGFKMCGKHMRTDKQLRYHDSVLEKSVDRLIKFSKSIKRGQEPNMSDVQQIADAKKYAEKEPRKTITCKRCNKSCAVYFRTFFCPFCGYTDPFEIYVQEIEVAKIIADLDNDRSDIDANVLERNGLNDSFAEKSLISIITAFEAYCKAKYAEIVDDLLGSETEVSNQSTNHSFQNLRDPDKFLLFNIDIKSILGSRFSDIQKYFEERHVFVHNSGIIDQNFIDNTTVDQNLLGQKLFFHQCEIQMLVHDLEMVVSEIENNLK